MGHSHSGHTSHKGHEHGRIDRGHGGAGANGGGSSASGGHSHHAGGHHDPDLFVVTALVTKTKKNVVVYLEAHGRPKSGTVYTYDGLRRTQKAVGTWTSSPAGVQVSIDPAGLSLSLDLFNFSSKTGTGTVTQPSIKLDKAAARWSC